MDLGELRARLTAEAGQMKQEIRAVKREFASLGDEGAKTAEKMERLNRLTAQLENINGRIELQRQKLRELKQSYDTAFNPAAKNRLQEQILKTEASLMRLIDQSDKTANEIWELEESMNAVADGSANAASDMDLLDQALKNIGLNADQIKLIKRNLDTVDPTTLERQLEEVDRVLKKLGVDSQEIEKIKQELRDTTNEAGKTKDGINALASGIAALGSGVAMKKLVDLTKTLANEANQLANSYRGLSVVANSFNVESNQAIDLAERLADRWGLNRGVMADVVKTYLTMNLSLEETERIITATADAAAYNRQAHLSWDEAIKQVAEGIKAGNSNLTDAAGITTNLSVMYDRYAQTIGKTAATLSEAEKVQAAMNGMLEEGAIFAGNADDAMTGLNGTQATFKATLEDTRIELGEAYVPIMEKALQTIQPLIRDFGIWASENKEVVAGMTAAGIAVTGLIAILTTAITVVAALTAAFRTLNMTVGPVGWAITGISLLAAGIGAYEVAANMATQETHAFADSVERLNGALDKSPLSRSAEDINAMREEISALNKLMERQRELIVEVEKAYHDMVSNTGEDSLKLSRRFRELYDELIKLTDQINEFAGIESDRTNLMMVADQLEHIKNEAQQAEEYMRNFSGTVNESIEQSISALREMKQTEIDDAIQKAHQIELLKQLADEYEDLTEKQNRTREEQLRLNQVSRELERQIPSLIKAEDALGNVYFTNSSIIRERIQVLQDVSDAQRQTLIEMLTNMRNTAAKEADIIEAQINNLSKLRQAWSQVAGMDKAQEFVEEHQGLINVVSGLLGVPVKAGTLSNILLGNVPQELEEKLAQMRREQFAIEDLIAQLERPLVDIGGVGIGIDDPDKPTRTLADIQREQYQQALRLLDYKRNLNKITEEEEVETLEQLLEKYKDNADIRMDLEVRIYKLRRQLEEEALAAAERDVAERFQFSAEWIAAEERRLRELGATEREIAQMRLEAWTRVRNRYESDTEFYKRADLEMYNARMALRREDEREQKEVDTARVQRTRDITRTIISEIDKARKAELDALDERKKAIQKFYDDQLKIIDKAERGRERQAIIDEMEKYRLATSEKGQKRYLELQEELRKMDLEDEKDKIREERDMQLEALDQQKRDINNWYNDLKTIIEDFSGDFQTIYQLTEDARFAAFVSTNQRIIEEMRKFKQEYESLQPRPVAGSIGTDPYEQSILYQMQANAKAWHTADPETRKRLEADSERLGAQIGAQRINGVWYRDGVPLFHTGGVVGEMNFQTDTMLMPDEIHAILKRSETVFTDGQLNSLIEALTDVGGGGDTIYIDKVMEINDVTLEDRIDIETFGRDAGNTAADVLRKKLVTGSD